MMDCGIRKYIAAIVCSQVGSLEINKGLSYFINKHEFHKIFVWAHPDLIYEMI